MSDSYSGYVPKFYVDVERKVNLGNFESISIRMNISQLPYDVEPEDLSVAVKKARLAMDLMIQEVESKVDELRVEGGS